MKRTTSLRQERKRLLALKPKLGDTRHFDGATATEKSPTYRPHYHAHGYRLVAVAVAAIQTRKWICCSNEKRRRSGNKATPDEPDFVYITRLRELETRSR